MQHRMVYSMCFMACKYTESFGTVNILLTFAAN